MGRKTEESKRIEEKGEQRGEEKKGRWFGEKGRREEQRGEAPHGFLYAISVCMDTGLEQAFIKVLPIHIFTHACTHAHTHTHTHTHTLWLY